MNISELVEVAIGLVLVWLLLALASMGIQEWIASVLKFRAKDLEKTIRDMLEDPDPSTVVDPAAHLGTRFVQTIWRLWLKPIGERIKRFFVGAQKPGSLVADFYNHPLIRAMAKRNDLPSYVPAHTFALALFDIAMNAGTEASPIKTALKTMKEQIADLQTLVGGVPQLPADLDNLITLAETAEAAAIQADAIRASTTLADVKRELDNFENTYKQLKPVLEALMQTNKAKNGFEKLNDIYQRSTIKRSLGSLLDAAEAAAEKAETVVAAARTSVEQWFDDTMSRLSGQYKRRAQVIGIVLGIALAILLNVDAVVVAQTLWREPTLRQAAVVQAGALLEAEAAKDEATEGTTTQDETTEEKATPSDILEETKEKLEALKLPIGWVPADLKTSEPDKLKACSFRSEKPDEQSEMPDEQYVRGFRIGETCWVPVDQPQGMPDAGYYIWIKVLGWSISGFASAQGSPFWFDVLKRLTNVRLVGANPAEEKQKQKGKG